MRDARRLLLELVQRISEEMASPLRPEELEHGWTEESRQAMMVFFERLREDVEGGVRLCQRLEYSTILRGLDHWGITEGRMHERASQISTAVREVIDREE